MSASSRVSVSSSTLVAADVETADDPAQRDERTVVRDDRRVGAQAEHDAAVGDLCAAACARRPASRRRARRASCRALSRARCWPARCRRRGPSSSAGQSMRLGLVHLLQRVEQVRHGVVVDHVLVDVPAGARRRGRELAVLAHDRGGPGLLARREIEERPVEHFAQTEDAVLAVELVRPRCAR